MLRFKGSQTQALWRPAVLACTDSSMEGPFDGFRHGITDFNRLERWQLWLHPSHRWPAHKNGVLWADQGYYRCPRTGESNYWFSGATSGPPGLHHQWSRNDFYIQVLVFALLLPRYQKTTLHCVLLSNRWVDGTTKQYDGGISLSLYQLQIECPGKTLANGQVCIQQRLECKHPSHTIWVELWLPTSDVIWGKSWLLLQVLVSGQIISRAKRVDDYLLKKPPPCSRTLKVGPQQKR